MTARPIHDGRPLKFHRALDDINRDMQRAINEGQSDELIDSLIDEYENHPVAIAQQAEYDAADAVVEKLERRCTPALRLAQ